MPPKGRVSPAPPPQPGRPPSAAAPQLDRRSTATPGGQVKSVGVFGRFRPCSNGKGAANIQQASHKKVVLFREKESYEFELDGILEEIATQQRLYEECARDNVATVIDGMCSTLMAYGQTGSGKTHAMFGPDQVLADFESCDPALHGMIPRALDQIFSSLTSLDEQKWSVSCSFIELYLSHIHDLLGEEKSATVVSSRGPNPPQRQLREGKAGVFVEGLKEVPARSVADAIEAIKRGSKQRMVAEMNMNARSSRGHAIFSVSVIRTVEREKFSGKLHLVDLVSLTLPCLAMRTCLWTRGVWAM